MAATEMHSSAKGFVAPSVITIPITDRIIADIMPFYPKWAKVISGYLDEEQLYWKVNYHWEVLLEAIEHCKGLDIDKKYKANLEAIANVLKSNSPDPNTGYRKSNVIGLPKDKSSHERILARHKLLAQSKKDFRSVVAAADIFKKSKRNPKAIMYAYSAVAAPNKGKHKTGYALDISGINTEIVKIAKSLGSTLAFNEGSHVHCEWKNGVDTKAASAADSVGRATRGARIEIDRQILQVRHSMLRIA